MSFSKTPCDAEISLQTVRVTFFHYLIIAASNFPFPVKNCKVVQSIQKVFSKRLAQKFSHFCYRLEHLSFEILKSLVVEKRFYLALQP